MYNFAGQSQLKSFQRIDVETIRKSVEKDRQPYIRWWQHLEPHRLKWSLYNSMPLWFVSKWDLHRV